MINKIQYTILTILTVTILISLSISNVSVQAAMAVNPETLQGIQTHLTEVQKALDNNDVEGAKMHLNVAMEQLTELQNKAAEMKKSSAGMSDNTTTTS
jgi:uncharacterized membrane protein (DUF106 family)